MQNGPRRIAALLCLPLLLAASSSPVIESGRVRFPKSGKVLVVPEVTVVHLDPLVALAKGEPVKITRNAIAFEAARRVVVVETNQYYEGSSETPLIYDYDGTRIHFHGRYTGPLLFASTGTVFFACGQSSHSSVDESIIVRESGEVVATLPFRGYLAECVQTPDKKLVARHFFVARLAEGQSVREWVTLTQVLDYAGVEVFRTESVAARSIEFDYRGAHYELEVPGAEPPG